MATHCAPLAAVSARHSQPPLQKQSPARGNSSMPKRKCISASSTTPTTKERSPITLAELQEVKPFGGVFCLEDYGPIEPFDEHYYRFALGCEDLIPVCAIEQFSLWHSPSKGLYFLCAPDATFYKLGSAQKARKYLQGSPDSLPEPTFVPEDEFIKLLKSNSS